MWLGEFVLEKNSVSQKKMDLKVFKLKIFILKKIDSAQQFSDYSFTNTGVLKCK